LMVRIRRVVETPCGSEWTHLTEFRVIAGQFNGRIRFGEDENIAIGALQITDDVSRAAFLSDAA